MGFSDAVCVLNCDFALEIVLKHFRNTTLHTPALMLRVDAARASLIKVGTLGCVASFEAMLQ